MRGGCLLYSCSWVYSIK